MPHRSYPNVCGPGQRFLAFIRSTICPEANSNVKCEITVFSDPLKCEANDVIRLIGPSIFIPFSQPWPLIGWLKIAVKAFAGFEAEISRAILPFQSRLPTACIARGRFHAAGCGLPDISILPGKALERFIDWSAGYTKAAAVLCSGNFVGFRSPYPYLVEDIVQFLDEVEHLILRDSKG
jgi:hypothetical protein